MSAPVNFAASLSPENINGIAAKQIKLEKLHKATCDFEAVFVKQLLGQMRQSLTEGSLMGDSQQGQIYQDMMDTAVAKQVSDSGQFGLSRVLNQRLEHTLLLEE